ncbi:Hypothetical protein AJAP_42760 (plasmid) [Amycolatopsis japonica]|uniref:Uncharacterized protein n=1 Tax=Amycolatopsis japonica TaxID=208439 RepID=A0A075V9W1_9PSEU|nr:hypothetical protein [Amycolatopsis japonica]AIG81319.1 Hypothetical protein AJAP_42760 [Amycolatopsis japonica]
MLTIPARPDVARLAELNTKAGRPTEGHPLAALTRAEQDEHHELLDQLVQIYFDEAVVFLLKRFPSCPTSLIDYANDLLELDATRKGQP